MYKWLKTHHKLPYKWLKTHHKTIALVANMRHDIEEVRRANAKMIQILGASPPSSTPSSLPSSPLSTEQTYLTDMSATSATSGSVNLETQPRVEYDWMATERNIMAYPSQIWNE